jgi:glycosyltransferase involved in cell wall biosynthesis
MIHPGTIHPATQIAICITTFMRPIGLTRLLDALRLLIIPLGCGVRYIVVDNDPAESARPIVEAASGAGLGEIVYVAEHERGISQARNRALREAAGADWIAFMDDDDWPEPDWLDQLLEVQAGTGADVLLGKARPSFEAPPPDWVVEGGFFDRHRGRAEGEIPYYQAHTGGALIRAQACAELGDEPFDCELGLMGGEDTDFFWALARQGARIVWTDRAIVNEGVAATRAELRWLVARAYRIGNSRAALLTTKIDPRMRRRVRRLARTSCRVAWGAGRLVVRRGRANRVRSLQKIADGVGETMGLFGARYQEYRRVHGC